MLGDQLQWPLEGELLNWRDDKRHCVGIISTANIENTLFCCARVTDTEFAENSLRLQLISHSLSLNHTNNTEYLQDDCLRLRVKTAAVYFTSSF